MNRPSSRGLRIAPSNIAISLALGLTLVVAGHRAAMGLDVRATQNTQRLMPYQVFELTFQHEGKYHDPAWDATADVTFRSPSGKQFAVGGFFYGSSKPQKPIVRSSKDTHAGKKVEVTWPCDPADLWKARYAPSELGDWTYSYVFRNAEDRAEGRGAFRVVRGRVPQPGWVRINPQNNFRFVFEDGSPFYPVGFQDGVFDNNGNGSAMDAHAMEGPFRPDPEGKRPKPPAGALFARGPSMGPQNGNVYFGRHARAGFNLWRFSPHNFSLPVFHINRDPNSALPGRIQWEQAIMVDEMLQLTRKYGIRNFYGIFGFAPVFNDHPDDQRQMAKIKRLIKYSVDRWGAYVDFWELLNEQKAADGWYKITIPYLKSIDPYQKPVATSWERPDLEGIDISAPHWYGREDEQNSDHVTAGHATRHKKPGKPVVYGEQGNGGGRPELIPQGIGGVWDPASARRMRIRLWAAMFHEVSLVFWETSYAKDGHHMNLWIGPEERQYVKALQDFSSRLDPGVRMADVHLAGPQAKDVRAYGLRSDRSAAVYLRHFVCQECARSGTSGPPKHHGWNHDPGKVEGLQVTIDVPQSAAGYWYSPLDASILGRVEARQGRQTFTAPAFAADLALLVTDRGPPDVDGDGQPNDADMDNDNDGVPNAADAYPLEREESADADADRIGDNLDADINGDGVADDRNGNGVPDNEETDWDSDGVPNALSIPWDAFPRDSKECRDTDGDGLGDNADPDLDGDGFSNEEEKAAGTDPLSPISFP